jgi:hypothetical protein
MFYPLFNESHALAALRAVLRSWHRIKEFAITSLAFASREPKEISRFPPTMTPNK